MKVILVTAAAETERKRAFDEPESPAQSLKDLGCDVQLVGFDLTAEDEIHFVPPPQVIVIDARERLESAYACLKNMRAKPALATVPVIIAVTVERLSRLDVRAADDFILVPVVPAELYQRLRQLDWRFARFSAADQLKVGDLLIDLLGYAAYVRDRKLELTLKEFELLKFLLQHPNRVWTREQLLSKVWGYRYFGGTRTVDIHIRRVRAKLGAPQDAMIETVRNVGYKAVVEDPPLR